MRKRERRSKHVSISQLKRNERGLKSTYNKMPSGKQRIEAKKKYRIARKERRRAQKKRNKKILSFGLRFV